MCLIGFKAMLVTIFVVIAMGRPKRNDGSRWRIRRFVQQLLRTARQATACRYVVVYGPDDGGDSRVRRPRLTGRRRGTSGNASQFRPSKCLISEKLYIFCHLVR